MDDERSYIYAPEEGDILPDFEEEEVCEVCIEDVHPEDAEFVMDLARAPVVRETAPEVAPIHPRHAEPSPGAESEASPFSTAELAVEFVLLVAIWTALAWPGDPLLFAVGAAACAAVTLVSSRLLPGRRHPFLGVVVSAKSLLLLFALTIWHLVASLPRMAWQVITLRTEEHIARIRVNIASDLELMLISNIITLTPGTFVLDTHRGEEGPFIYVHFSNLRSIDAVDTVQQTIARYDRLIGGLFR